MKTIKYKILAPFLTLIIVIPFITLLFFNIAMRIYVNNNAKRGLITTVQAMNTLINKELSVPIFDFNDSSIDKAFSNIHEVLRASKLATNTELLLFDKKLALVYPRSLSGTFIDKSLVDNISQRITSAKKNEIYTIRSDGKTYLISGYSLTKVPLERTYYIAFVTSLNDADGLINTVNIILLLIMLLGITVGIYIANRVSNRISNSVTQFCKITEDIGRGKFILSKHKTDIKELSNLHQSINIMSSRLEAYDTAQKTFLQDASHELRTPLMSIQGYAEGIISDVLPDTKHAAKIINSESKRLNALIDELLTLSRIENQTYRRRMEKLNLIDVMKEYAQRLDGIAIKEKKQLIMNLPDREIYVFIEDHLLSQAVMNIASNCIRYAKSTVTISIIDNDQDVVIRIADDGCGINKTDLPHIFERFYKGKGGNFGLGLAISKSAVEFMGGSISAYNSDSGAVFEITLKISKGSNHVYV